MRAFLAVPVCPPALEAFLALRAQLVVDVPAVRWTPAESPHITLHFFGAISAADTLHALQVLRPIVSAQRPLALRLRGLGAFPSPTEPHVLWWGVDGDRAELSTWAVACRTALSAAGFAVEDRPYRAHCTLGRPARRWPSAARQVWQRRADDAPVTPTFIANRAVLYESLSGPAGVRHVPRDVLHIGATT